jgi:hypothetical protein
VFEHAITIIKKYTTKNIKSITKIYNPNPKIMHAILIMKNIVGSNLT